MKQLAMGHCNPAAIYEKLTTQHHTAGISEQGPQVAAAQKFPNPTTCCFQWTPAVSHPTWNSPAWLIHVLWLVCNDQNATPRAELVTKLWSVHSGGLVSPESCNHN